MTIGEFYSELVRRYPESLRCQWDNDGMMCSGDLSAPVKRIMVALDATAYTIDAAAEAGCNVLLTHHPLLFRGVKSVTEDNLSGGRILRALKKDVSVISLHTRLDAGECGVNDTLASLIGLTDTEPFGDADSPTIGRIGTLDESLPLNELARRVKNTLTAPCVTVTPSNSDPRPVRRIAVLGGAGKDLIAPALSRGADALVTGEVGYNARIDGAEMGLSIIEAGHFYTENPVVFRLSNLAREITGAETKMLTYDPTQYVI